jgi:hypothetical protein
MINLNVKNRIEALEYLFSSLEKQDEDALKFEAQLIYFLLVAVYGAAQYCIKTLFIDWINPDLTQENLKKLEVKIDRLIQTPSIRNVKDLFLIVKKQINSEDYSKYNHLIYARHRFAHGETDPTKLDGVTLKEIKSSFEEMKKLLNEIESLLV